MHFDVRPVMVLTLASLLFGPGCRTASDANSGSEVQSASLPSAGSSLDKLIDSYNKDLARTSKKHISIYTQSFAGKPSQVPDAQLMTHADLVKGLQECVIFRGRDAGPYLSEQQQSDFASRLAADLERDAKSQYSYYKYTMGIGYPDQDNSGCVIEVRDTDAKVSLGLQGQSDFIAN